MHSPWYDYRAFFVFFVFFVVVFFASIWYSFIGSFRYLDLQWFYAQRSAKGPCNVFQVAHSADRCNVFFIIVAGASVICTNSSLLCLDQREEEKGNSQEAYEERPTHLLIYICLANALKKGEKKLCSKSRRLRTVRRTIYLKNNLSYTNSAPAALSAASDWYSFHDISILSTSWHKIITA